LLPERRKESNGFSVGALVKLDINSILFPTIMPQSELGALLSKAPCISKNIAP
jgi:hypothetical protein